MNQDHFRQLLSSSSSSSQRSGTSSANRSFGSRAPKRSAAGAAPSTATNAATGTASQAFAPRQTKKRKVDDDPPKEDKDYSNAAASQLLEELQARGGQTVQERLKALEAGRTTTVPAGGDGVRDADSMKPPAVPPSSGKSRDALLATLREKKAALQQSLQQHVPEADAVEEADRAKTNGTNKFKSIVATAAKDDAPPKPKETKSTFVPPPEPDVNGDEDIFGGAGEYTGLDDDNSDDDESDDVLDASTSKPNSTTEAAVEKGKGKVSYFDEDEEEKDKIDTSTRGTLEAMTKIATRPAVDADGDREKHRANGDSDLDSDDDEEKGKHKVERLQPLSSSAMPSVRDLLDADKAAEAEEKRLAKKAKRKAKQSEKQLSAADQANKDYMQMQSYLKKREGAKSA